MIIEILFICNSIFLPNIRKNGDLQKGRRCIFEDVRLELIAETESYA